MRVRDYIYDAICMSAYELQCTNQPALWFVYNIGRSSALVPRWGAAARASSRQRTYLECPVAYNRIRGNAHDRLHVGTRYGTVVTAKPNPPSRCKFALVRTLKHTILCDGRSHAMLR